MHYNVEDGYYWQMTWGWAKPCKVCFLQLSTSYNNEMYISFSKIQALAIASYFKEQWPLLIVCPSSVRFAWRSAVIRWLQSIDEEDITVVTSAKDPLEGGQVVIISYDLLHKKQDELVNELGSNMAILDESHLIKTSKSARTKAAENVFRDCRRVLLLSGTPALSR